MLKQVKTQKELDSLEKICWDDSDFLVGKITIHNQEEFPKEINYPGNFYPNYHLIYEVCSAPKDYLELVFVNCEFIDNSLINTMYVKGSVSKLFNITLTNYKGDTTAICSALLYKYHNLDYDIAKQFYSKN